MRIFLTNLGKYNEGELVGQWLDLPATAEEIVRTQWNILIDGEEYEEYFITDYEDSPFVVEEYHNLEFLNEVAEIWETLNEREKQIMDHLTNYCGYEFEKAAEKIKEGDYQIFDDISDEVELGYALAEDWEIPEHLKNYIDYESIGREATFSGWYIENRMAYYLY